VTTAKTLNGKIKIMSRIMIVIYFKTLYQLVVRGKEKKARLVCVDIMCPTDIRTRDRF